MKGRRTVTVYQYSNEKVQKVSVFLKIAIIQVEKLSKNKDIKLNIAILLLVVLGGLLMCGSERLLAILVLDMSTRSHVWGGQSHVSFTHEFEPKTIPRTIEDAIIVVCQFGGSYLWADFSVSTKRIGMG